MIKKYVFFMYSTHYYMSLMKRTVSTVFWKNTQVSKLMKIRQVVAELFHVGGRTDRWRLGRAET